MSRPLPPHGTATRYRGNRNTPGCRCTPCTKAASREDAVRELERMAGNPRRVPAAPVWKHIEQLHSRGLLDADILRAAGLSSQAIMRRIEGQRTMTRERAQAILAIPLDYRPDCGYVAAAGAIRRVQALCSIGHSAGSIASRIDVSRQWITKLAWGRQTTVSYSLDAAIRDLYPRLIRETGTCVRAIKTAERRGWQGPEAWDDNIDDPAASPSADLRLNAFQLARARSAEMRLLASAGALPEQIAERTGIDEASVRKHLRTKHRSLYLELTA